MCGVRLVEQELCGANKINLAASRQHHRPSTTPDVSNDLRATFSAFTRPIDGSSADGAGVHERRRAERRLCRISCGACRSPKALTPFGRSD